MWNRILKKIGPTLAAAALFISVIIGWDQLTAPYAKAENVKRNVEHIHLLVDAIGTLVKESTKTRLFVQMDRVDSQIHGLEKKYYGSRIMSLEVRTFYDRLLNEKKQIQKRLDK